MGNREWGMENEEQEMKNEEWGTGNEEWVMITTNNDMNNLN